MRNNLILPNSSDWENLNGSNKHFMPATKEWSNSVYMYDKHMLKLLPELNHSLYKLLNSYFNMSLKKNELDSISILDKQLESKEQYIKIIKNISENFTKRYTVSKTFLSELEIKHTVNNGNITAYIYDRKNSNSINNLKNEFSIYKNRYVKINFAKFKIQKEKRKFELKQKNLFKLRNKSVISFISYIKRNIKAKSLEKLNLNVFMLSKIIYIKNKKRELNKFTFVIKKNINNFKHLATVSTKRLTSLLSKRLKKSFLFKHKFFLHYSNCFKFNNNNLINLKNLISKIFSKKIVFNMISLKYLHVDSSILAKIISTKLIDRTKKILKVLHKSIRLAKKPNYKTYFHKFQKGIKIHSNYYTWNRNLLFSNLPNEIKVNNIKKTNSYKILNKHILFRSYKFKNHLSLSSLKNKWITGIRIQGKGRITKRLTALRSLSKMKYMGTLKNILSSYQGISAYSSKGFAKSNLQYANISNYSANGAFSVKVSISAT